MNIKLRSLHIESECGPSLATFLGQSIETIKLLRIYGQDISETAQQSQTGALTFLPEAVIENTHKYMELVDQTQAVLNKLKECSDVSPSTIEKLIGHLIDRKATFTTNILSTPGYSAQCRLFEVAQIAEWTLTDPKCWTSQPYLIAMEDNRKIGPLHAWKVGGSDQSYIGEWDCPQRSDGLAGLAVALQYQCTVHKVGLKERSDIVSTYGTIPSSGNVTTLFVQFAGCVDGTPSYYLVHGRAGRFAKM